MASLQAISSYGIDVYTATRNEMDLPKFASVCEVALFVNEGSIRRAILYLSVVDYVLKLQSGA